MKQLDLILSIVAIVVGFVIAFVLVGTRRTPQAAPAVPKINVTPVMLPPADATFTNSLPGATPGAAGTPTGRRTGKGGAGFRG